LVVLCLLALPATAQAGRIVADSGFRPDPDGFSFSNYGDAEGYGNLNADQMQRMFGEVVCLTRREGRCVLTPAARSWMESQNLSMSGGHCYGFAVLSSLLQKRQLPMFGYPSPSVFGAGGATFDLAIERNALLQRSLARAWTYQTLPSVNNATDVRTPAGTVEQLRRVLSASNPESWTAAIFKPGYEDGHAITPYALERMGDGVYDVHVYDNNWPADSKRRLRIDTKRNRWAYYAATRPGQPSAWYRGTASSGTFFLLPSRPGLGTQPCYFCYGRQGQDSKYNQVTLDGAGEEHSHLLITDDRGRRTGFSGGRFLDEIPGVEVTPRSSGGPRPRADGTIERLTDSVEPLYKIPKQTRLSIKVDGDHLSAATRETLTLVGPTYDAAVENMLIRPGESAKLKLAPQGEALTYRSARSTRRPTVSFGAQAKGVGYRIQVVALEDPGDSTLRFVKDARRQRLYIDDNLGQDFRVGIERQTRAADPTRVGRRFAIRAGEEAYLDYGPLARPDGTGRIVVSGFGKRRVLKIG